ncbi:protein Spindly isoform X3 [Passer montanus]|uniref:protein Spindly isoform X3 n=1 Tax=Passer montanus TaxID=9160 RepID=UPI001961D493|nr:protein Spindly isoform X3 [Passer montanus]
MEAETILSLKQQLKEAENERKKAAQYGLHLLESQSEIQNQLDQARCELTEKTEKFEQEKYTLQREIELKNRMLESLNFECDSLKQQQNLQLDKQKEQLDRAHGQEISDLKNKLENLKAELDETRLSEKQLRQKVEHQKEIIAAKSEELHMMSEHVHETMSSEMLSLQIELTELQSQKANDKEKLNELQCSKEQLELVTSNLRNQLERLQGEKEEREKEVVFYCNALELQMATLLQLKGSQAEFDQLERLQSMLEQKNGEIKDLLMQVRQLEKFKSLYENMEESRPANGVRGSDSENDYYADLLQIKLDKSNKEMEALKNELSLQRMKALHESQRVLEFERKLFSNERHLQACQSENMNLRVMLDELKMKYEPEELLKDSKIKKKRERIPVNATCEYFDSKNTPVKETALTQLPSKEGKKMTTKNLEQSDASPKNQPIQASPLHTALQAIRNIVEPERERKRVKIQDENHVAFTSNSRSGNNSSALAVPRLTAESRFETTEEEKRETKISTEKKTQKKKYSTLYVSSKASSETQCAQQ